MKQILDTSFFAAAVVAVLTLCGCAGESSEALIEKSGAAVRQGHWEDALKFSDQVLRRDGNHLAAAVFKGMSLHELQRSDEAVTVLEQAAQRHPEHFAAQYFHGWILWETGQYAEALSPLTRAYRQENRHPDLLVLLSRCCLQQNLHIGLRYLQALRQFRRFRDHPEVYNAIAMLWFGHREYGYAREYFLRALDLAPHSPVILQNLAVLHDQYLQDPQQALYYYRHALSQSRQANDDERAHVILMRLQQLARDRQADG